MGLRVFLMKMKQCDLDQYYELLEQYTKKKECLEAIDDRLNKVQEWLYCYIFKGYKSFANKVENLFFKEEKQYKGEFKFELVDEVEKIEEVSQIIYLLSLFNRTKKKTALVAELAIIKYWEKIKAQSLNNMIFGLGMNGRQLKVVDDNFEQISAKLEGMQFQLLFYMTVTNTQNYSYLKKCKENFKFREKFYPYSIIANVSSKIIGRKQGIIIPHYEQYYKNPRNLEEHEADRKFQSFLLRHSYPFIKNAQPFVNLQRFTVKSKHFICLPHYYFGEGHSWNGLALLLHEYYRLQGDEVKFINYSRMYELQRRGERDDYIRSKFKGIEKPIKIRKSKFSI